MNDLDATPQEESQPYLGGRPVPVDLVGHPRYCLLEYLGSGGMGTVYKARHRIMERLVALKVINPDLVDRPKMIALFRREVKAAARLSHPNIVAAFDADQAGMTHFLVMEYIEGIDLDRVVEMRGRLPVARACDYARQAALGLQHAWERGMVHRDIKPHNLMLTSGEQIKILDFGLARLLSELPSCEIASRHNEPPLSSSPGRSDPKSLVWASEKRAYAYMGGGTADYIAPEEVMSPRQSDIRADIYSLGCTLYRLLSGRVPFPRGDLVHKVRCHLDRMPRPLLRLRPEVPPRLGQIVERMLAKDPAQRYQKPAEVVQALAPFAVAPPRPILIVDDDLITRTLMADVFQARGYPVVYAGNGQEALDRLRQGLSPSLIVLDLMMPVMDGWAFLQQQRRDPALAAIPVVIVSAADLPSAQSIALGAADYLHKPIEPEQLTARVQGYALSPN